MGLSCVVVKVNEQHVRIVVTIQKRLVSQTSIKQLDCELKISIA